MIRMLLTCLLLSLAAPASALSSAACGLATPTLRDFQLALDAAQRLRTELDQHPAPVALVARRGGDISHLNLIFTHAALAIQTEDQRWQVIHLLNDCAASGSSLYREGLAAFFLQQPHSYQALVQPLPQALAQRIQQILTDPQQTASVHESRYSLAAHPLSPTHQNSNGFILEVIALAISQNDKTGRAAAQGTLRATKFTGTEIKPSLLERRIGPLIKPNLTLEDQPDPARPRVVTVRAIVDWLQNRPDMPQVKLLQGPLR